ncbi:hypothetical protein DM860_013351 [Cuscuta australis]|uniref:Uncharacterized protein n=1 Tax=Cuscuta australis TaxID=267555 RepID=A0A328DPK6_9ASTE|nr:hypothetical protein DM860_013351 [Cuscuta australis]
MRKERRELNRREQQSMYSPSPSISAPPLPLMVFSGVLFFFLLLENDEPYNNTRTTTTSSSSTHHGFLQLYLIIIFVLLYVHVITGNARWLSRRPLSQPMRSSTVNRRSSSLWGLVLLLVLLPAMVRYRAFFIFLLAFLFLLWSYTG